MVEGEWKVQEEFIADIAHGAHFHKLVNFLSRRSSRVYQVP